MKSSEKPFAAPPGKYFVALERLNVLTQEQDVWSLRSVKVGDSFVGRRILKFGGFGKENLRNLSSHIKT